MKILKPILFWLFGYVAIGCSQIVPLNNAEFQFEDAAIHLQDVEVLGWEISRSAGRSALLWDAPADSALALGNKSVLSQTVDLSGIRQTLPGGRAWRLILAVDVIGTTGKKAEMKTELFDAKRKKILATKNFEFTKTAPRSSVAVPKIMASSFKAGSGRPEHAIDGNPDTIWHSDWGRNEPGYPHSLTFDLGRPRSVRGFTYVPRKDGGNGTLGDFELLASNDFSNWQIIKKGKFAYENPGKSQSVKFDRDVNFRFYRLNGVSSNRGDKFASCAEFVLDVDGQFSWQAKSESPAPIERCFLPLSFEQSKNLGQLVVKIGVTANSGIVLNRVHLFFAPEVATGKMRGKANGHSGPDFLGAGSYGFDGLMIHRYPAIPIINVHKQSNAFKAGLKKTDLIVGINDCFLPLGNVNPGFDWFESSHEALLGRAAMDSLSDSRGHSKGSVRLNVLRNNEIKSVDVQLDLPEEIYNADFFARPETLNMINADLIRYVLATQLDDGSWKRNPVHTSLGGLALLSLKEPNYAPQIKACANWLMSQNAEPSTGFYWHPAFSGIFLAEYYLATGDKRVLPFMKRMLRMMSSAFHTSKWGTETFGHGPRGLPYGNKSLVAVMVHVILFETLAKRCGIDSRIYETLIPYLDSAWSDPADGGHGALGYNKSYKDLGEFWSRTGIFSLSLHLRNARPEMQEAMMNIMYKRHPWFRNSHAYGEPGGVLGLLAMSQVNNRYYREVISNYRWWFALAWERGEKLHFTIPHMGAPYMEGPELINNGYALLFNSHRRSLHMTGSKKRRWLNVEEIPVPISEVMILKDKNDRVNLRCRIPGPAIYYTTDGTKPSENSDRFTKPFKAKTGATIQALAVNASGRSNISQRLIGLEKKNWSIHSATGNRDIQKAVSRAANAIDGDFLVPWVTDVGEGSKGFPHDVVIDLGKNQDISLVTISNLFQNATASKIRIETAKSKKAEFEVVAEYETETYSPKTKITLHSKDRVRLVKIVFEKSFSENTNSVLMVGEIDLQ